jgi:hypothetical protein
VEPILTTAKKHGLVNKFLSIDATKAHAHTYWSVSNYIIKHLPLNPKYSKMVYVSLSLSYNLE